MKRLKLFLMLLGWFVLVEAIHSVIGASYIVSLVAGVLTTVVLFLPDVRKTVRLDPISAGVVVLVSSALDVLFLRDNVFGARSAVSIIVHLVTFALLYLLLQSRLEILLEKSE